VLEAAQRQRHFVTVLLFDLDDFKRYNDQYGHDAGDEILVQTTQLMQSVVRPSDRVCRIGGDEFAVIFYDPEGPRELGSQHPADVEAIAKRFEKQIQAHTFPALSDLPVGGLTISGGLATFPWDGTTPETLLKRADELALRSKRDGKKVIALGTRVE
jgi:two-component system, cell cycle response regulator